MLENYKGFYSIGLVGSHHLFRPGMARGIEGVTHETEQKIL